MRDRKIKVTSVDATTPYWIPGLKGIESSRFLVTKEAFGCESFSFHFTVLEPGYDRTVSGDGVHEYVQYTFGGSSRRILKDGTVHECTPGTVIYLPPDYEEYRHVVGPQGVQLILACTPPRSIEYGVRVLEEAFGGVGGRPQPKAANA